MHASHSGHIYSRILTWSLLLVFFNVLLLIWELPDIVHTCVWPTEKAYGGGEDVFFVALVVSMSIQAAHLLIVGVWIYHEHETSLVSSTDGFDLWDKCGVTRKRAPPILDWLQGTSLVVNLVLLRYHGVLILVCVLLNTFFSLCILFRIIFSPTALCIPAHRVRRAVRTKKAAGVTRATFHVATQRVTWAAALLTALFLGLYLLQYAETFGTTSKFYRTDHLRKMNDPLDPFHQDLVFPSLVKNQSQRLGAATLPTERVVWIVIDGLQWEEVKRNPAFRTLLHGPRQNRFRTYRAKATLPTMSAPNWLALLTGAAPEITGLRGNILSGETEFDSIFSTQRRIDVPDGREFLGGLTGCKWWSDMVVSQFPRLKGDGTVEAYSMYDVLRRQLPLSLDLGSSSVTPPSFLYREEDSWGKHTDDVTDRHRVRIACEALNDTRDPFRFFLAHLANPDTEAHGHGTTARFDPQGGYSRAIAQTVQYVENILDTVDAHPWAPQTTVFLTSDHGEVAPGGHGGTNPVLSSVPLLVYSQRLEVQPSVKTQDSETRTYSLVDLAPTTSALLGLPAPRQASGHWMDPETILWNHPSVAYSWKIQAQDLLEAKRERINVFLLESGYTSREWCQLTRQQPLLDGQQDLESFNVTHLDNVTLEQWVDASRRLEDFYENKRSWLLTHIVVRNMSLSFLLVFFLLYYYFYLVARYTLLPMNNFSILPSLRRLPDTGKPLRTYATQTEAVAHSSTLEELQSLQVKAVLAAFGLTCLYLLLEIALVLGYYGILGYTDWDSTMVHSVSASMFFLLLVLVSGFLLQFFLLRLYHLPWIQWDATPLSFHQTRKTHWCLLRALCLSCVNCCRLTCLETTISKGQVKDLTLVYLIRIYMMGWILLVWGILLVLQGSYSFLFPFLFSNWILTETTWTMRFRVVSLQLMAVPLLVGCLVSLCSLSRRHARHLPWKRFEEAQQAADIEVEQAEQRNKRRKRAATAGLNTRLLEPMVFQLAEIVPHEDYLGKRLGTTAFAGLV